MQYSKILYKSFIFLFVFSIFNITFAQEVSLGAGHYNLSPPPGGLLPQDINGNPTYPFVTSDFNQAPQTNDWWSSLIFKQTQNQTFLWEIHSWKLYAHPLAFVATRYGLNIKYQTNPLVENFYGVTNGKYQYPMSNHDFTIGLEGLDLSTVDTVKTASYGDWHVKAMWEINGKSLQATMTHGSPFVFFEQTGADNMYLRFLFGHSINHRIGDHIISFTTQGNHYALFTPSGSTINTDVIISHDENSLVGNSANFFSRPAFESTLSGNNYFSIALLPDTSLATLQEFSQHAYAFITDTKVSWNYDKNTSELISHFQTITDAKEGSETATLCALYPHQWLHSNNINTNYEYQSPRGIMKTFKGNTFATVLKNNGIIPALPMALSPQDSTTLYTFIADEFQVSNTYVTQEDTYWMGKRMGRQADLIQLANQVGHVAARDKFINDLKTELEDWFRADNGETDRGYFYYDSNWHTLIGYPTSYGTERNITDHHFHYAYFIKAVATIAQYDKDWASDEQWGSMAKMLIQDGNNWDRNNSIFPFLRCFDVYAGHSWANGSANSHFGNDQEASSEAMNFAAATYFFGLNTEQDDIRDLGLFLYLTEASAIEQYWFDKDQQIFPAGYSFETATRIWGNGADKIVGAQSYEGESEYQLGINAIPVQASGLYLGKNQDIINNSYTEANNIDDGIGDLWEDVMWCFQAMADPETALTDYLGHTTNGFYNNNLPWLPNTTGIYHDFSDYSLAPAQVYHWLKNLDSLGQVVPHVCANYSSTLVFEKDMVFHYTVYNPSDTAILVNFSDGASFSVPANGLYLFKINKNVCNPAYVITLQNEDATGLYEAGRIEAYGNTTIIETTTFKAGVNILLEGGFCVPAGMNFEAVILGCEE